MVISSEDKRVLLERLQKARETKAAKAAAKKKETLADVKEPTSVAEPPAPVVPVVPVVPVMPVAEPVQPPPSEPIDIPAVPDLVAASKKKPKKVSLPDSDSDEEAVLPPKKKAGKKETAYMKIKIYREPKNAAAFQQLMEAVQEDESTPEAIQEVAPPTPASASIGRGCRFADANAKNQALKKGTGVMSHQEIMRRAALEFFG